MTSSRSRGVQNEKDVCADEPGCVWTCCSMQAELLSSADVGWPGLPAPVIPAPGTLAGSCQVEEDSAGPALHPPTPRLAWPSWESKAAPRAASQSREPICSFVQHPDANLCLLAALHYHQKNDHKGRETVLKTTEKLHQFPYATSNVIFNNKVVNSITESLNNTVTVKQNFIVCVFVP